MKQPSIIILITVLMSMGYAKVSAHDIAVENADGKTIYYNWINNKTELTVCYQGSHKNYSRYEGNIIIPESVEYQGATYSVTSISSSAFYKCSGLTSLTIPNSVTSIGSSAFYNCSGLTSLIIPNSVMSIGDDAFYGCSGLTSVYITDLELWCKISFSNNYSNPLCYAHHLFLNGTEIKALTIPSNVTSIGDWVFYGCSSLTSLTIPNSVISIGNSAFRECTGLTSLSIPNSVTSIGSSAFYNCSGLTSLAISNQITSIKDWTFSGCSGLTSLNIPNSVTSIGDGAFSSCSGLTSLTIPNSVTSIGSYAFHICSSLTSLIISNSVTSIGSSAFTNCSSLTSLTIPNSVTSIKDWTFSGCSGLTSLTIPNSVTSIDDRAFSGCSGLTSLTIPNSVTSIGNSAFDGCSGLSTLTIPNSVTAIGDGAFSSCSGLTSLSIPNSVMSIGRSAFENTGWYNNQPDGLIYLDNCLIGYKGDKPDGEIAIKDETRVLANSAFYDCSGLTSVAIPSSVASIGTYAFSGCSGLVNIISGVQNPFKLNSYAFSNNSSIRLYIPIGTLSLYQENWSSFTLIYEWTGTKPENVVDFADHIVENICINHFDTNHDGFFTKDEATAVTNLGTIFMNSNISSFEELALFTGLKEISENAFYNCSSLATISIPDNVTSIGLNAFMGCKNLLTVNSFIKNPFELGFQVFSDNPYMGLYVPVGTLSFYQNKWKIFKDIYEWDGVIPTDAIHFTDPLVGRICVTQWDTNHNGFLSIDEAESVTDIGQVFKGLNINSFDELKYFTGLEEIADEAFYDCSLTSVIIPNGVKRIGKYAFKFIQQMKSVTIPSSVSSIDDQAFYYSLDRDFYQYAIQRKLVVNISDLTSWCKISFGNNVFTISNEDSYPQRYKLNLNGVIPDKIVIPEDISEIKAGAFSYCENIESLVIHDNVQNINQEAFQGCPLRHIYVSDIKTWLNLNFKFDSNYSLYVNNKTTDNLEIPDGITKIDDYAFYHCISLNRVILPNSVTSIGSYAFSESSLRDITIPNSVQSIDSYAFASSSLNSIRLSEGLLAIENVQNINQEAFHGCPLRHIYVSNIKTWLNLNFKFDSDYSLYVNNKTTENLEIPDGITKIDDYAFYHCISLNRVILPNSVTNIGSYAFSKSSLRDIIIPNSVQSIDSYAFASSSLNSIKLPDGLLAIENYTFSECSNLSSITLPNTLYSIGIYAFYKSGLKSIVFPNSIQYICRSAFEESSLQSIIFSNSYTTIYQSAFSGCSKLSEVILPNTISSIKESTFYGCKSLTSIKLPESLTSLEKLAFSESGLRYVALGNKISNISSAFYNCGNLQYIWLTSNKFPSCEYSSDMTCQFIMPQETYNNGIPNSIQNFATYSDVPTYIKVTSKGAVSAVIDLNPINGDGSLSSERLLSNITCHGLAPNEFIKWKMDDDNYGIVGIKTEETMTLEVQESKALSTTKARLLATVKELDDVEHFGFEWRRIDAPDLIASSKVYAPLYNGTITGTLNNLKDDVYYKYRPFYQSDSGETFYGEWMGLFTGDANVFFEPEVYTKDASDITKVSALLAGVWFEGTEDIEEKGFEYWTVSGSKTRAVSGDVKTVVVTGNKMTATIESLQAGKEYGYRSYAKTASGTTYGEEKVFRTILVGDVNSDGVLDEKDLKDLAAYIMGKTPEGFNKKEADLNGDDKVNAADIVKLVKLIGK